MPIIKSGQPEQGVKNPIDNEQENKKDFDSKIYSEEDKNYLTFLQKQLEDSKTQKDNPWSEWNNKNYWQIYEDNEKFANTKLPEKQNPDDVIVSAGTIEAKLDAVLSSINNLNLSPEVSAFDRDNNELTDIGKAFEDIIYQTEKRDGDDEGDDEEKKIMRQRELLKQGVVFVQETWEKKFETKKKLKTKYKGQFKIDSDFWSSKLEKVFEGPERSVLHGPNVYLGNMTEYYMNDQPFIFILINQDYETARKKYGKFENWDYVTKGEVDKGSTSGTIYENSWRLSSLSDNQVEIILYQDQPNDEFQIIINGVLMLPIGFPLSAVSPGGKYNVAKQVLRPFGEKFAYGKSFVSSGSIKQISQIMDEMLKLMILKTRKSYVPPYLNITNKKISRNVLSAGRITMGIPPDALQPIGQEGQGVTSPEFQVLKELSDKIDKSTVSPTFSGQQGSRSATATEILELQKQSKLTLGLTITACSLLEKKCGYLRLWNILDNWFEPIGTRVVDINGARKTINRFRKVNREDSISGQGIGEREVITVDTNQDLPEAEVIRELENRDTKRKQKPIKKIFLSREGLKNAKMTWHIVVSPKEKETSNLKKVLFREQLSDMLMLMNLGSKPNLEGLEDQYSRVWDIPKQKIFGSRNNIPQIPEGGGGGSGSPEAIQGRVNQAGTPSVSKSLTGNNSPPGEGL